MHADRAPGYDKGMLKFEKLIRGPIFLSFVLVITAGCASTPDAGPGAREATDSEILIPRKSQSSSPVENEALAIDYLGLQRHLGLDRMKDNLGYVEKSFDTCEVGYGYSSSRNCRRHHFVLIHFQILCRESEGTISTALSREDMKPLSGRSLIWTLANTKGNLQLDGEGFGQIKTTFPASQKTQRLKLAVDNDFVYVRAGEVKRLVTPQNWCN